MGTCLYITSFLFIGYPIIYYIVDIQKVNPHFKNIFHIATPKPLWYTVPNLSVTKYRGGNNRIVKISGVGSRRFFLFCILKSKRTYAIMPIGRKRVQFHKNKERIPQPCCSTVGGFFFSFYGGKAPTRLFVTLVVPVQPFADQVADQTRRDSHQKREYSFHKITSSRCRVSVGQR